MQQQIGIYDQWAYSRGNSPVGVYSADIFALISEYDN